MREKWSERGKRPSIDVLAVSHSRELRQLLHFLLPLEGAPTVIAVRSLQEGLDVCTHFDPVNVVIDTDVAEEPHLVDVLRAAAPGATLIAMTGIDGLSVTWAHRNIDKLSLTDIKDVLNIPAR